MMIIPKYLAFLRRVNVMTPLFYKYSSPALCRGGHGTLERQSTQSTLSIQLWAFYTTSHTSKKQRHFVLCSNSFFKIQSAFMNTKLLRFRFGSAIFTVVRLFF